MARAITANRKWPKTTALDFFVFCFFVFFVCGFCFFAFFPQKMLLGFGRPHTLDDVDEDQVIRQSSCPVIMHEY